MLIKILLLLVISFSAIYAEEGKFSGYLDLSTMLGDVERYNGDKIADGESANRVDMVLNYDKVHENFKFTISQGYFQSSEMYNNLFTSKVEPMQFYYINELSLEYIFNNNFAITAGVLPFKNGTFHEYSFTGDVNGNSLILAGYQNVNGIFGTYKYGDFKHSIGYAKKDWVINSEYNLKDSNSEVLVSNGHEYDYEGSGGLFYIGKYKKDKHTVEVNLFDIDIYLDKKKVTDTVLGGAGYSYDDSEYSGNIFYTIFMYSRSTGDSSVLNNGQSMIGHGYHFGKIDTSGHQYLLGYKHIHDSLWLKKDVTFNLEYVRTEDGYLSMNVGKPFAAYSSGSLGDTWNASIGLQYNQDLQFKLRYCLYRNNGEKVATGGVAETTKTGPTDVKTTSCVSAQMIYKF